MGAREGLLRNEPLHQVGAGERIMRVNPVCSNTIRAL